MSLVMHVRCERYVHTEHAQWNERTMGAVRLRNSFTFGMGHSIIARVREVLMIDRA